jgi:hypothetical protein
MAKESSLVQRLIAFLKRPNALEYDKREPIHNAYDDFQHDDRSASEEATYTEPEPEPTRYNEGEIIAHSSDTGAYQASRLDALVMRIVNQFNAQMAFVIRYDEDGRMRYCTGRNARGEFVPHTHVDPDRRAIFLVLDSGESHLFVDADRDDPVAVLCGPLWIGNQVEGVLYLDNPARSHLHRGVFDVLCNQTARLLADGVGF